MADSVLNVAALATRLQDKYIPGCEEILSSNYLLSDNLKKAKKVKVEGNRFIFLTHTGRNEGHGWRAEQEDLPEADFQKYNQATVPAYYYYHVGAVTGPAMSRAKGAAAFVTEIQGELERIMKDALREHNIYYYGDQSGTRGTVSSVAGQTITCRFTHVLGEYGINYLRKGMRVRIRNAAGTAYTSVAFKIVRVDLTNRSITAPAGIDLSGVSDGDIIFIDGNWDPTNGSKECLGVLNGIDDGTRTAVYLGMPRVGANSIPEWQSTRLGDDAAPANLTLSQLQELETLVDVNAPEPEQTKNNIYITTHTIRDFYFLNLIQEPSRRFIGNDRPLRYDAGFAGVDYNSHRWYVDRDCPRGVQLYMNISAFQFATLSEWDFLKDLRPNGGMLILQSNKDSYKFYLKRYQSGPFTLKPRQHGIRVGINDTGVRVIN